MHLKAPGTSRHSIGGAACAPSLRTGFGTSWWVVKKATFWNLGATSKQQKKKHMINTSINTGKALKAFSLILALSALPLVCALTGCAGNRYTQSTGERIDDTAHSSRVRKALSADTQYKYGDVNVQT